MAVGHEAPGLVAVAAALVLDLRLAASSGADVERTTQPHGYPRARQPVPTKRDK